MKIKGSGILAFLLLLVLSSFLSTDAFAEARGTEFIVEYASGSHKSFSGDSLIEGVEEIEKIASKVELWSFAEDADVEMITRQLQREPGVLSVEPNYERHFYAVTNDPLLDKQWWIPQMEPQAMWSLVQKQKKPVVVAVIDSGIAVNHEDLVGRIHPDGYNFHGKNTNVDDNNGHGTGVSGMIVATSGNQRGITGIAGSFDVKVLPLKISDVSGTSYVSDTIKAIDYAIEKKVDVINLSLGSDESSNAENSAIQRAIQAGITVVAASGNEAEEGNPIGYPAAYDHVISVGATDKQNRRSVFSNYNSFVSVVAPGTSVYTTDVGNSYRAMTGTSFSSPIVAGAAAIVKSLKPELTPNQIKKMLEDTAIDLGVPGKDPEFGAGLVNLHRLQEALAVNDIRVQRVELDSDKILLDLDEVQQRRTKEVEAEVVRQQAAVGFEAEPNNTWGSANLLTLNNSMMGTITDVDDDVDFYRFTTTQAGLFKLWGTWIETPYLKDGENEFLQAALYDQQQKEVGRAKLVNYSDGKRGIYFEGNLVAGTYTLRVEQNSPYEEFFMDEEYRLTNTFVTNDFIDSQPVLLFDRDLMKIGDSQSFVSSVELGAKFTSSNPQVVTVDEEGTVRALARGEVTIRYISPTTTKEARVKVAVPSTQPVAALFETVWPKNATDQSVTWTSSDPTIAAVDEYGVITGKKAGRTVVSVRTNDGGLTAKATVDVVGGQQEPEVPVEFIGDFPNMSVKQDKVFKVNFNQRLQVDRDYAGDILISRTPNGQQRITTFTATVNPTLPTQLLITPIGLWDEGAHYMTIKKDLRNRNQVSLKKDMRMRFDVLLDKINSTYTFESNYDFDWIYKKGDYSAFRLEGKENENGEMVGGYTTTANNNYGFLGNVGDTREVIIEKHGEPLEFISKGSKRYKLNEQNLRPTYLVDGKYVTFLIDRHAKYTVRAILWIDQQTEESATYGHKVSNEKYRADSENLMYELVNQARYAERLNVLEKHSLLADVARSHSKDMAQNNYFSHTNLQGLSPEQRLATAGLYPEHSSENSSRWYSNVILAHEGMMNSLGHRNRILNDTYSQLGIGIGFDKDHMQYVTQQFMGL